MHYRVKTFISLITGFHGIAPVTISRNHHFSFRLSLVGIKQLAPWGSSPFFEIPARYVTRKKSLKDGYYEATRILAVQYFLLSEFCVTPIFLYIIPSILKILFLVLHFVWNFLSLFDRFFVFFCTYSEILNYSASKMLKIYAWLKVVESFERWMYLHS